MKNIIKIFFVSMFALAFASCDVIGQLPGLDGGDDKGDENKVLNEDIEFTLEVIDVKTTSARIKVSHDGADDDTWYGFATPKTAKILDAVNAKVAELNQADKITGLKSRTDYTFATSGLEENTDYTFIVFGLSEAGEFYGNPVSIDFKTKRSEVEIIENENWTVAYTGAGIIYEEEYEHTVTVTSTDENKFFISVYEKEMYDQALEETTLSVILEYELMYLKSYVDSYNEAYQLTGNNKLTIDMMLSQGEGIEAFNLYPGDWIALAIGVDENGEISGYYALSEVFNIAEEEATPEYASWLGKWRWTGANGVSMDVEFKKEFNNMSYKLVGWEGETNEQLAIPVSWLPEQNLWLISTTAITTLDYGEYGYADLCVCGTDAEGAFAPIQDFPICIGGEVEGGSRQVYSYEEELEDGTIEVFWSHFRYYAYFYDDETYYKYSDYTEFPSFPATLTKIEDGEEGAEGDNTEEGNPEVAPTSAKSHFTKLNKLSGLKKGPFRETYNQILK